MLSLEIILSFVIFCNKNVKKETFTKECLFFSVFYFTLYSVFSRQYPVLLEQSCNLSSSVYIDTLCCRNFRQTWHGHDVTGQGYDEACTCGNLQISYSYFKVWLIVIRLTASNPALALHLLSLAILAGALQSNKSMRDLMIFTSVE